MRRPVFPRSLSVLETAAFAFSGLILWVYVASDVSSLLGQRVLGVWIIAALAGAILNFQAARLASVWPDVGGGTAVYASRLYRDRPILSRYVAWAYALGWMSGPPLAALFVEKLVHTELGAFGYSPPVYLIRSFVIITVITVGYTGVRSLSIVLGLFLIPALAALLAVIVAAVVGPKPALGVVDALGRGTSTSSWLAAYSIAAYATYGCDTAAVFVAESKRPNVTIKLLRATGIVLVPVYTGAAWISVAARASGDASGEALSVSLPIYGASAVVLITFLVLAVGLLSAIVTIAIVPRILHQLAVDGKAAPVLAATSPQGVPGPAVTMTSLVLIAFFAPPLEVALTIGSSAFLASIALFHLGIVLNRGKREALWPGLAAVLFALEVAALVMFALKTGPFLVLFGLATPFALIAFDAGIVRLRFRWLQLPHWVQHYRLRRVRSGRGVAAVHIAVLLLTTMLATVVAWLSIGGRASLSSHHGALLAIVLIAVALVTITISGWTTIPRIDELAHTAERADQLLESALDAKLIADSYGEIIAVNPAAARLFDDRNLVGKRVAEVLGGFSADPAEWPERTERVLERDGAPPLTVESVVSRFERGRAPEFLLIVRDATERARLFDELGRARDEALAASKMKSQFLANMSHEIRTPLTAVLGFADLLVDKKVSESERINYLLTIRRNGEHLVSVINDVLDLSKIEADAMNVEMIDCSLDQLLHEISTMMKVRAAEKGLTFSLHYTTPIPATIRTDPTRLRQILLNLVANAVKFTERGNVEVTASVVRNGTPQLQVEVADKGIGLTAEQIGALFQPFRQADASLTRRYGGTGLGLAISRRLASLLGGSIEVRSSPDEGSTFSLRLPITLDGIVMIAHPPSDTGEALAPASMAAIDAQMPGSVLVAEDGIDNQILISRILVRHGVEVTIADNGRIAVDEALAAQRAGTPFDLILMDMQMPELDGYGATSRLRAEGYTGTIVALTAHAMVGEKERCLAAGCDEYLTKPLDRRVFLATVRRALERPGGYESAPIRSTLAADSEVAQILPGFIDRLAKTIAELQAAKTAGDADTVRRIAHQLKGAGASYGFAVLTDIARLAEADVSRIDELLAVCQRIRSGV